MDLYSKLEGKVVFSCVIFLVVFKPIIQYIKEQNAKTGYEVKTNNHKNSKQ